jgi:hypothetical protein
MSLKVFLIIERNLRRAYGLLRFNSRKSIRQRSKELMEIAVLIFWHFRCHESHIAEVAVAKSILATSVQMQMQTWHHEHHLCNPHHDPQFPPMMPPFCSLPRISKCSINMKYVEFVGSPSCRNVPRWSFYIKSRETVKPEQREELKIRIRTVPTANHLTMPRRLFIVINDGWDISEIVRIGKFYKQLEWEEGSARRGDGSRKVSSVKNPRLFLRAPRTVCLEMPLLAPFIEPQ